MEIAKNAYCNYWEERMMSYFDHEIQDDLEDLIAHIDSCKSCKSVFNSYKAILRNLEFSDEAVPSQDFETQVMAKVRDYADQKAAEQNQTWISISIWFLFLLTLPLFGFAMLRLSSNPIQLLVNLGQLVSNAMNVAAFISVSLKSLSIMPPALTVLMMKFIMATITVFTGLTVLSKSRKTNSYSGINLFSQGGHL